jgi:hypothetical protein
VLADGDELIDRDAFRAAVARVRERTGAKGKALLHPIRLALMGEPEGVELDLAVPAMARGARLGSGTGLRAVVGPAARAAAFVDRLERMPPLPSAVG